MDKLTIAVVFIILSPIVYLFNRLMTGLLIKVVRKINEPLSPFQEKFFRFGDSFFKVSILVFSGMCFLLGVFLLIDELIK